MSSDLVIRPFADADAPRVRALFVAVNRLLAPADRKDAFEGYIARSLREEIDRIPAYYAERHGGFWVALAQGAIEIDADIVGMFGLEAATGGAMELRRMYVDPAARRRGIARAMLRFAEDEVRRRGATVLTLSTSELQREALALYRNAGYRLLREEIAEDASNKTVGGGIRRFYFEKALG